MKIEQLADEAKLSYAERRDHLRQLEEAIANGRSKRPASDLDMRRSRLPAARAIAVALKLLAERRAELPADLVAAIEGDAA
jgi:hypothetical protein